MATIVPPPSKRQRREDLERSRQQQDVTAAAGPSGSFKARFVDGDGNQTEVVEIPLADASEKNLSLLFNTLLSRVRALCASIRPAALLISHYFLGQGRVRPLPISSAHSR